ncbi:MAG: FHA domain-containing protein [Acidimicrobiales bacterium]
MSDSTTTCPAGHESATEDYCNVCGVAIGAVPSPPVETGPVAGSAPGGANPQACPNCGSSHEPDDAFCEVCGLDIATGELPKPPPPPETLEDENEGEGVEAPAEGALAAPAVAEWVAVATADLDFYEMNEAEGGAGAVSFPADAVPSEVPLTGDPALIGRRSETQDAQPDIVVDDPGVSRRHAVLQHHPDGWQVVDQGSTNGTRVGDDTDPIEAGTPVALGDGDYVLVGAFTRITIRRRPQPDRG